MIVYANLSKPTYDFQYELFWWSCRKRTRINSNQTFHRKAAKEGKIWCIWSYLIINIIIEIIITDQTPSMVTHQGQPPQRWCIWWSALERSHQALLDTCLPSDPALFRDIICKLVCYTTPYIKNTIGDGGSTALQPLTLLTLFDTVWHCSTLLTWRIMSNHFIHICLVPIFQ